MKRLAWLLTPSTDQLLFALRLCLAIALALYLSMWLELDRPYWASLEVAVMIQPVPGMAVARGFARATGTIVAGCAGLAIMGFFGQYYELSAAALALWVAFCAFWANLLRNNLSYGFAIAGFIAGVTVMLSHSLSTPPFDIAVARVSECVLAALVTAAVNVLFSPPTGIRNYFNSRLALLRDLGREFVGLAALSSRQPAAPGQPSADDDPHPALQALAAQTLALEQTRQYLRYEAPQFANFDRLSRRLDYDILSLISATSSLHIYLAGRTDTVDTRPVAALAEPAQRLSAHPEDAQGAKQAFNDAHDAIRALADEPAEHGQPRSLADYVVLSRALGLASRGRAAMTTHGLLIAEREHPSDHISRRSEFGQPMDVRQALRNSLRTLTAVSLGGVFWVNFHNQLPAVLLMILLSALTTIFATLPNPVAAAGGFAKGLAMAATAAFVIDFLVLPQAAGFAMLMLAMLPVVFVGGLAMAVPDPGLALPGRISVVMFSLLVHVQNGALPSFTTYIQIVLGIFGAIGLTVLAFKIVLPVSPRQRLREQMRGVFDELADGRRHTRERFETRMYDRLNALALSEIEEPFRFSARQAVLAAINIGLEARSLVVLAERVSLPQTLDDGVRAEMDALRGLFAGRRPGSIDKIADRAQAIHQLAERLLAHGVALDGQAERRLVIRAAICAELVASALSDYVLAFEHGKSPLAEPTAASQAAT
ncbi:FUSC family protein [Salinisphaera hydrothermalis]|uniref:Fusaric acid resistance protein n=1 Tax=Salinisphaera hydrothermalis (strain C41B8) TaxID=1304275 RepID=A0A084IKU5_SALHC|nr:FUSC family protein [Salinisphaera hydrothermalis]KEZ77329.1 fusaric acid resistance protein [Salinisphaera hydrothermalis C41B8]